MKTNRYKKFTPVLLCMGILLIVRPATSAEPVPNDIKEFYKTYNFVSSFSTPAERAIFYRNPQSFQDNTDQPKLSGRLQRVLKELEQVQNKIWRTDSGIELMVPYREKFLKPELLQIQFFSMSENTAMIHVLSYPLNKEDNASLISWYETQRNDQESISDQAPMSLVKNQIPHKQIHFWFVINERWVINEKKIGLLK